MALIGFAAVALANNLDRRTATSVAKEVAQQECQRTAGCRDYYVRRLQRVSRHKSIGKIVTVIRKRSVCVRQIVIKLDHDSGQITFGTSDRRCTPSEAGPPGRRPHAHAAG